ncbi:S-DNA-T family DNA segregation ATPase FtsK/SpoIIIE [Nonomuraea endophytica]|uniref:S-DNA-T family DNA segregation ATPase FtsK/SpoIIIE n=1 Tax=Nonomuraea endophytica TaxID=714136 RepID=A0A7W8A3F3_9ACTN|nr:S-DNA-T family DNA segregation ATPase FtsK/SpoIIIE [Nonomuraea endophytica]
MRRTARRMRRAGVNPVMYVDDDIDFGGIAFSAIVHFLWRYRSELAPIWVMVSCEALALALHLQYPDSWTRVPVVSAVLTLAILLGGRWLGLRLALERAYGALISVSVGVWLTFAAKLGPGKPPLPAFLLIAGLVLAIPWWVHRRRRARVRVERTLAAWPEISSAIEMVGSRVQSAIVDPWGYRARIKLARGHTVEQAIAKTAEIESALGTRRGAVRILPVAEKANRMDLRVIENDPHANSLVWPGPSITSIKDQIELGLFEDGSPILVSLLRRHALVGGIAGSGKSGGLNAIIGNLSACEDVVLWGIDLKRGMELMPWASCFDRIATDAREAELLLNDAVRILDHKAELLAKRGERLAVPSREEPALIVVIDEFAELAEESPNSVAGTDSIARRGRAPGTQLVLATQRPSQSAMGGSSVRSQMDIRLCFRVREKRDADLTLGAGMHKAGWHADRLDAPGKFFISAPGHDYPRRGRAYLLSDEIVQQTASAHSAGMRTIQPPPQPAATANPDGELSDGPSKDVDRSPVSSGEKQARGAHRRSQRPLELCLRDAPADGASISDLLRMTGMGRTTLHNHLKALERAGRARRVGRGRWAPARQGDDCG